MKKIVSGISFMFFGLALYLVTFVKAVELIPQVTSWRSDKGKLWQVLYESYSLIPNYIGIFLCILGISFILWGNFEKK